MFIIDCLNQWETKHFSFNIFKSRFLSYINIKSWNSECIENYAVFILYSPSCDVVAAVTEEQALHQLYLDEQFGALNKDGDDEKNK